MNTLYWKCKELTVITYGNQLVRKDRCCHLCTGQEWILCKSSQGHVSSLPFPAPQSRHVWSSVLTQRGRRSSRTPSQAFHFACCHGNQGRSAAASVLQWSNTPCTTRWWSMGRRGRGVVTAKPHVSHRSVLLVVGVSVVGGGCECCWWRMWVLLVVGVSVVGGGCECCWWWVWVLLVVGVSVVGGRCGCCWWRMWVLLVVGVSVVGGGCECCWWWVWVLLVAGVSVVGGGCECCWWQMWVLLVVGVSVVGGGCECCWWWVWVLLVVGVGVVGGGCECC